MDKRRERGRLGARGVGECEVEFEWGTVGKGSRIYGYAAADACARTESEYIFLAPSFWAKEKEKEVIGCVAQVVRGSVIN